MNIHLKNLEILIKEQKVKFKTYKKYGVYFIEFETTGLQVREMKRIIEFLPLGAIITSNSDNRSLCINTRISV